MQTTFLNKIVAERQRKCVTGHILIDTKQGIARGYAKAKNFQSQKQRKLTPIKLILTVSSNASGVPYPVGDEFSISQRHLFSNLQQDIFKYLGIDYAA